MTRPVYKLFVGVRPSTATTALDDLQVIDAILLSLAHEKKVYVILHFAVGLIFQDVEKGKKHTQNLVSAHIFCFSLRA